LSIANDVREMLPFTFSQAPLFLTFGRGALAKLPDAMGACDAKRAIVVPTPSMRATIQTAHALLGAAIVETFENVEPHVPGTAVDLLLALANRCDADVLIAIGGGAAIDLCKAAVARTERRVIAVPTTYGGSELTIHAGRTDARAKSPVIGRAPRAVIYDPDLTLDLPVRATAGSAMNALAHCVEALYAPRPQPLALLAAREALRRMPAAMRAAAKTPHDAAVRTELLYGGYLAGIALAGSGMALHHRICHVLGGRYGIAHGDANAVILPHAARFNETAAPEALAVVARALDDGPDVGAALARLARDAGAPQTLAALGLAREELPAIADLVLSAPLANPAAVERAPLIALLERAYDSPLG
jgi:maleylacetate reductase